MTNATASLIATNAIIAGATSLEQVAASLDSTMSNADIDAVMAAAHRYLSA